VTPASPPPYRGLDVAAGLGLRLETAGKSPAFHFVEPPPAVGIRHTRFLVDFTRDNGLEYSRLCLHAGAADALHNMIVCQARRDLVRPHRHDEKDETYQIVSGVLYVMLFEDDGSVHRRIRMAADDVVALRVNKGAYHATIAETDFALFHESRPGPFRSRDAIEPAWGPLDTDDILSA